MLGSQNNLLVTQAGRLLSYDLGTRAIKWQRIGGFKGNLVLANGVIYVATERTVEAREESSGALIWTWEFPLLVPGVIGDLIATDNVLLVGAHSTGLERSITFAVDLSSRALVWSYPAGGRLALSSDGVLLIAKTRAPGIAGYDSNVVAIDVLP